MVHSLTLLAVLLVAAPLAKNVPLAALAAILMVAAWNMGVWRELSKVFQQAYADVAVWAATFTLTVFADLTVAVQFGMILAALLFIGRIANATTVSQVTHDYLKSGLKHILQDKDIPPLHNDPAHPRSFPVRFYRQADGMGGKDPGIPAHRAAALAQHDRSRRDWIACH
jgi:MFS superfamily sulfate permease-like transporter